MSALTLESAATWAPTRPSRRRDDGGAAGTGAREHPSERVARPVQGYQPPKRVTSPINTLPHVGQSPRHMPTPQHLLYAHVNAQRQKKQITTLTEDTLCNTQGQIPSALTLPCVRCSTHVVTANTQRGPLWGRCPPHCEQASAQLRPLCADDLIRLCPSSAPRESSSAPPLGTERRLCHASARSPAFHPSCD